MSRKLFIFEDDKYDQFFPLTYNRPVYELLCGITKIREKITFLFPDAEVVLLCRDYLENVLAERTKQKVNQFNFKEEDEILLINGRVIPTADFGEKVNFSTEGKFFFHVDDFLGWCGKGEDFNKNKNIFQNMYIKDQLKSQKIKGAVSRIDVKPINYLWDLVLRNGYEIEADFDKMKSNLDFKNMFKHCQVDDEALIYNMDKVYIGKGSQIDGQVVLDVRSGSIYIGERVKIQSQTLVKGPCYVGDDSVLAGGKIREGTSIGPFCRIGGEVDNSIFLGYSNKYHEGFLGHSYVGEWVNLGALTTNSDLKNNYGTIRVMVNGTEVDSEQTKVGAFIGDHAKTGIGTLLNTGVTIGFASNLFGGGMLKSKSIPSFFWGSTEKQEEYKLAKSLETAKAVLKRRGRELTQEEENVFKKIFKLTEEDRGNIRSRKD
jgi:UDP-N-acetylglucosamine diphosphorylase/glucosamine-1-phosphate N-acetyltransferase